MFQEVLSNSDKHEYVGYTLTMKLSQYAKQQCISYRTALWWQAGLIKGYQAPTGTIIVAEEPPKGTHTISRVAIFALVSSQEHRANFERHVERLEDHCASRGYQVAQVVKEIASGVNDARPKLMVILQELTITRIVFVHQDRLTPFGFHYLETLLELARRHIEVVNQAERSGRPAGRSGERCVLLRGPALRATAGETPNGGDCQTVAGGR
jgi:putative resolvase